MMKVIAFNLAFKVSVEVVFTPVTYAIVGWLKRQENEDWVRQADELHALLIEGLSRRRGGRFR